MRVKIKADWMGEGDKALFTATTQDVNIRSGDDIVVNCPGVPCEGLDCRQCAARLHRPGDELVLRVRGDKDIKPIQVGS